MERLRALWYDIVESLWFLPSLMTVAGGALAILLVRFNEAILGDLDATEIWWIFGGSAEGASSVLEAISGSIITVTGVVFSVTIIALQLASSQFTPRVLRQFLADRANQTVLGVFIGTFTYTLLVQRTLRAGEGDEAFVPAVAVTGAVVLALVSIGFLIFYINHVARSIQASVIIDSAATSTLDVLGVVYPEERGETDPDQPDPCAGRGEPHVVRALRAGYLQGLQARKLGELAVEHDLLVRVIVEMGSHPLPGSAVMHVWPRDRVDEEMSRAMAGTLIQGLERTPHEDLKHGLTELMDIAVKGLSPGVNDPTTALNALQRTSEILQELAWRKPGELVERDGEGQVRVLIRRPQLADAVDLAFRQVRHFGVGNPSFAGAMLEILGELAALSPEAVRGVFVDELRAVIGAARERIPHEHDLRHVEEAARRALERSREPAPMRPPRRLA